VRKFSNWLTAYEEYTKHTESPNVFNRWCGLSAIAAALGRKVWFNLGRIKKCPNLFVVLVAEPGCARKTQAISYVKDVIREVPAIYTSSDSITPEALLDELEQSRMEDQLPTGKVFIHNSLTIIIGEFEAFLGHKKDNNKMIILLTDFYDCRQDAFKKRTKHSGGNFIEAVFLNLLSATTPSSIANSFPPAAIGGGLSSRIMFIWSGGRKQKIPIPEWTSQLELQKLNLVLDLNTISRISGGYNFSPCGREWWINWYLNFDERDPERLAKDPEITPWYARKPDTIIKVCQCVAAAKRNELLVYAEDFQDALTYVEEVERDMVSAFKTVGRSDITQDISLVLDTITAKGKILESELLQIVWKDVDKNKLNNIIETLLTANRIKRHFAGRKIWYSTYNYKEK